MCVCLLRVGPSIVLFRIIPLFSVCVPLGQRRTCTQRDMNSNMKCASVPACEKTQKRKNVGEHFLRGPWYTFPPNTVALPCYSLNSIVHVLQSHRVSLLSFTLCYPQYRGVSKQTSETIGTATPSLSPLAKIGPHHKKLSATSSGSMRPRVRDWRTHCEAQWMMMTPTESTRN